MSVSLSRSRVYRLLIIFIIPLLVAGGAYGAISGGHYYKSIKSASDGGAHLDMVVRGIKTNALENPLAIDGKDYTSANIGTLVYASSRAENLHSEVNLTVSGFVPGDYVYLAVTITNEGPVALNISSYSVSAIYVTGNGSALNPDWATANNSTLPAGEGGGYVSAPHLEEYPSLNDYLLKDNLFATYMNTSGDDPYGENGSLGIATFSQSYSYFISSTCDMQWYYTSAVTEAVNPQLASGQSFTWNLFYGLGVCGPLNIPGLTYSLTFNFTHVN